MFDDNLSPDFDLIEVVYEAALHPEKFDRLIHAWDASFAGTTGLDTTTLRLADLEQKGLARHFERAGQLFAVTDKSRAKDPDEFIAAQRTAALLATSEGKILSANAIALDAFGDVNGGSLSDLPLEAQSAARVSEIVSSLSETKPPDQQTTALCGVRQDNEKVFVLIIEKMPAGVFQNIDKPTLFVRSTLTRWDERIKALLSAVFGLTPAELEILEMLNEGLKAEEISQRRDRSLKTVRTQIKLIGQKTRTNSQSELMRHISSLLILAGEVKETVDAREQVEGMVEPHKDRIFDVPGMGRTHVIDQGPSAATPVMCFYPTMPPLHGAPLERELVAANLRRVAIHKPGSGQSAATDFPLSFSQQSAIHEHVAEQMGLNGMIALGHCAGGISALEFALAVPERVEAVILVDTGSPLVSDVQWEAMPGSAKRTFFLAKNSPELLHTPHQVVAADFFSGDEGKRRIVDYFYADQGDDIALLRDPETYRLASDMIAYCLADTAQLIEDVRGWTQDWSDKLLAVCDRIPVTFIHGSENLQFPIEDVRSLAATHENMRVVEASGAAQLTLFTHSELICRVLKEQIGAK